MPRKDKLFSNCRKQTQANCLQDPKCIYTNGKKYKYCRLSHQYILDKTDKQPKHRITNKRTRQRSPSPTRTPTPPQTNLPVRQMHHSSATRKIKRFFRNTTFKRRAAFLNRICQDSNLCIALGKENRKIKAFFNDFQGLEFIHSQIQRVGTPSSNGFIHRIHYNRNQYDAYAIIKSSSSTTSDNLAYEYLVGKFLNQFQNRFPLFVETYALYSYVDEFAWNHFKNTRQISKKTVFRNIQLITNGNNILDEQIENTCIHSKHLAVLIQDIKNPHNLDYELRDVSFVLNELIYILFHVYSILHTLRDSYTHYDLHHENVLIYTLNPDEHIEYIYHVSDTETVQFKSKNMVKIIDYGRSFFPAAEEYYEKICKTKSCKPKCGDNFGYNFLNKHGALGNQHYIWSKKRNQSHDLRLLTMISNIFLHNNASIDTLFSFLNKVIYQTDFGTIEQKKSGLPHRILNVSDAFHEIKNRIPILSARNDTNYSASTQIGVLHIYLHNETPMRFVPSNP